MMFGRSDDEETLKPPAKPTDPPQDPPQESALFSKRQVTAPAVSKVNLSADEVLEKYGIAAEVINGHSRDESGAIVRKVVDGKSRFTLGGRQSEVHDDKQFIGDLMHAHQTGIVSQFLDYAFPRQA